MTEETQGADLSAAEDTAAADQVAEDQTQAQGDEQSGDDAPAATVEGEAPAKPKKSAQERINELTAARREAERDRDFYREQALRNQPPATPAQEAQTTPQGDARPDPNDYASDFDYIEALTDWKAEQAAERLSQRNDQRNRAQTTLQTYQARTRELYPEGKPSGLEAFERMAQVPVAVIEIVGESSIGPKIAAHLGDNPAELARLERMSPVLQARELTLLETRLSTPAKPTAKTVSDAPEPPPQARGAGGQFKVAADTQDFAAFHKAFFGG